ncbi:MAG: sigma 54-interacting transcriptional regulator [Desulfovibrio sp.]|nr:sigma 54-interacting transcriptional regulator [Desulfovibrio sp.]
METAFFFLNKGLVWRMLFIGIPLISLMLFIVLAFTCNEVKNIVTTAIARNEQMHAEALAHSIDEILADARSQLQILAAGAVDKQSMLARLKFRQENSRYPYREIAFISRDAFNRYLLVNNGGEIREIETSIAINTPNSPFHVVEADLLPDTVTISPPVEVTYSMVPEGKKLNKITFHVIRLATPVFSKEGSVQGILLLSLDLRLFRNILSKSGIFRNPIDPKDSEKNPVLCMFFDYYGWILFQSENVDDPKELEGIPLRTDLVRQGIRGDMGRRGYPGAFRPEPNYASYQEMITIIQRGESGHILIPRKEGSWTSGANNAECISFAPVRFKGAPNKGLEVIGGVGTLGIAFTSGKAFSRVLDIFIFFFFLAIILISISLYLLGKSTSKKLYLLTSQLQARNRNMTTDALDLPQLPYEIEMLRENVDILLQRLHRAKTENASHIAESFVRKQNQPYLDLPPVSEVNAHSLVGSSQAITFLRNQIKKVAPIQADVLIEGETGTGKELVSRAIHDASSRADKPFISINCGALDENLLMDTLFGHVKGAFTEARQPRKGAFLAAEGGTLLLDEIGNAAPKVQQALLRALSTRSIRPLGSDQEISFDTRIIAATNADLRTDGIEGTFRNDLYYRLAVISLQTPPLRERKEDIPALVVHFMSMEIENMAATEGQKHLPAISQGAMDKLMNYSWPGNVRELKNVITRAVTFTKGGLLQASDIILDTQDEQQKKNLSQVFTSDAKEPVITQEILASLNIRQQLGLKLIQEKGCITRQDYQKITPEPISMRTAQYDLQQMVNLGLLHRDGRGSSMKYYYGVVEKKAKM